MYCMKCGRETEQEQVFCVNCLAEMEKYPVKPDVVVQLPKHDDANRRPVPRRKQNVSQEEQLARLKKKVLRYRIASIGLVVLALVLAYVVHRFADELNFQRFLGQNYSTAETVGQTEPSEPTETGVPEETVQ